MAIAKTISELDDKSEQCGRPVRAISADEYWLADDRVARGEN